MTDAEIRRLIADALVFAAVPGFSGSAEESGFLAGTSDAEFVNLEIDSLAAMELCIAIEANLDVSIVPAELPQIGSLEGLVRRVREALDAGGV